MRIHGQLTKETYEQIKAGAGATFPLTENFIKTEGGIISADEFLVLLFQAYGQKPFIILVSPSEEEPKANLFHREFLSDKLRER